MYRFIFVDDEDYIRELFADLMDYKEYGFELAAVFPSAEQALAYIREGNHVDAVLTDIRMGDLSGIEFSEYIYQNALDIEVVIISGYKEFAYAQRAIKCNVFDYLLKPTSMEDFTNLFCSLKAHLDQKHEAVRPEEKEEPEEEEYYQNIVRKVQDYIAENYASNVSLEEVAGQIGMNPAYLSRYFKQRTGNTFMEYVLQVRVNKAIELLKDSTIKVYEVGDQVGYKSMKHFYKVFKKITKVTPSQYREQWENSQKAEENGNGHSSSKPENQ